MAPRAAQGPAAQSRGRPVGSAAGCSRPADSPGTRPPGPAGSTPGSRGRHGRSNTPAPPWDHTTRPAMPGPHRLPTKGHIGGASPSAAGSRGSPRRGRYRRRPAQAAKAHRRTLGKATLRPKAAVIGWRHARNSDDVAAARRASRDALAPGRGRPGADAVRARPAWEASRPARPGQRGLPGPPRRTWLRTERVPGHLGRA